MMYSKLNNAQKAWLNTGSRFKRDTIKNGKVVKRGDAKSQQAVLVDTFKAVQRDRDLLKKRDGLMAMKAALAEFTSAELSQLATKLPPGEAKGARDLQRKRAGAVSASLWG